MNVIRIAVFVTAVAATAAAAASAASPHRVLVVDDDGRQCPNAAFGSIQAAVDTASPGDLVRVCPGFYAETVTVDKPLTLKGDPDAIEGASVGVDASDAFSGYRIHHDLIRSNTLFGVDFGSSGPSRSRVDHNCIRENRFGLVSELDDDSLWKQSDGPERDEWNARDLINARVDHNATFGNTTSLEAAGPGRHDRVTFDHNLSREDVYGIQIQNSELSRIVENDLRPTRIGIAVGGATTSLEIADNSVETGRQGIAFVPAAGSPGSRTGA